MIEQRSEAWHAQRAGKLTASMFSAALGLNPYCSRQKLWRRLTGREPEQETNPRMMRGVELEPIARDWYECETGNLVQEVGFIQHPQYDFLGASPDGLTFNGGCIEIKCPEKLHESVPDHYLPQCVGVAIISGRKWCDYVSYTTEGARVIRIEIDPPTLYTWGIWEAALVDFYNDFVLADVEPPRKKRSK